MMFCSSVSEGLLLSFSYEYIHIPHITRGPGQSLPIRHNAIDFLSFPSSGLDRFLRTYFTLLYSTYLPTYVRTVFGDDDYCSSLFSFLRYSSS